MVVRRREFVSGGPFQRNSTSDHFDDRCVNAGLGSHLQSSNLSRLLGCGTKDFTYQHPRNGGSDSECSTLLYSVEREGDSTSLRQCRSSHLHKQTRGDKIPISMHEDMAVVQNSQGHVLHDHCYSFGRHNNVEADHLSRHIVLPTEWCLNSLVLQQIFQFLGNPLIDLFASDQNHCLPTFCSWRPSVKALAIDAFTLDWSGMIAYSLRLSTNLSYSPSPSASRESRVFSDSESSILAQEGLVHEIAQPDSRYTTDTTRQERPSKTTNREIFPPKSQSFPDGKSQTISLYNTLFGGS